MNKNYTALKKNFEKAQKDFAKGAKELLNKEVIDIFKKYPKCESLGIQAYTDYFNDGDECHYHIHSDPDSVLINGNPAYDFEDEVEYEEWGKKASEEFSKVIEAIPEELFKIAFGDHIEITFNKNGKVTINEYSDHD